MLRLGLLFLLLGGKPHKDYEDKADEHQASHGVFIHGWVVFCCKLLVLFCSLLFGAVCYGRFHKVDKQGVGV